MHISQLSVEPRLGRRFLLFGNDVLVLVDTETLLFDSLLERRVGLENDISWASSILIKLGDFADDVADDVPDDVPDGGIHEVPDDVDW